jgi:16S rRNA (uracil1498-N3)-methyltransferase
VNTSPVRGPAASDAVAHVFVTALDERCEITGDDGHHLQRVRRLAPGEIVTAADDSGAWREYTVSAAGASVLVLDARAPVQVAADDRIGVSIAVALTKGGLDDVVAATTALGARLVTPLRTERIVVRWDAARAAKGVTRLRAVAREAAMQSRRARIPIIDDVTDLATILDRPGLVVAGLDGVGAWELPLPNRTVIPGPRAGVQGTRADEAWTVVVGPEGGLSDDELASFGSVARLRLAPNVLRAVHAPIAAVAALIQEAERRHPFGAY